MERVGEEEEMMRQTTAEKMIFRDGQS